MSEYKLLNSFGKAEICPLNYSDLIDKDKIAINDFFYFKQGYELAQKELQSLKQQLESAREVIEFYGDERNWGEDGLDEEDHDLFFSDHEEPEDGIMKGGKKARLWLKENQ